MKKKERVFICNSVTLFFLSLSLSVSLSLFEEMRKQINFSCVKKTGKFASKNYITE
jgi:hypothetical protein